MAQQAPSLPTSEKGAASRINYEYFSIPQRPCPKAYNVTCVRGFGHVQCELRFCFIYRALLWVTKRLSETCQTNPGVHAPRGPRTRGSLSISPCHQHSSIYNDKNLSTTTFFNAMVNKPERLYREDASRKAEAQRLTALNDMYRLNRSLYTFVPEVGPAMRYNDQEAARTASSSQSYETLHCPILDERPRFVGDSVTRLRSQPMIRQGAIESSASILRGQSTVSDLPEVLYAHLDTGFFFECFTSHRGNFPFTTYHTW